MTKFYVDTDGKYIGGFDRATPPPGAVEVPLPPNHANFETWNGTQWVRDADADDREADAKQEALFPVGRPVFKLMRNHENRIRVLEGQPALSASQFRILIRNLVKGQ